MSSDILHRFAGARVLVIGDVMLDRFIYGEVERISPEAPVPVLRSLREDDVPGGAANVARNIGALGAHVMLLSTVGNDAVAKCLRSRLAESSLIEAELVVDAAKPTPLKCRCVSERQQLLRIDHESCDTIRDEIRQSLEREFAARVTAADIVVISDYAKGLLTDELLRSIIRCARDHGRTIVVDPKGSDYSRYTGATILTPNRSELRLATGRECRSDEEVETAARSLLQQRCADAIFVTRGEHGITIVEREDRVHHLPALRREVFDVSGAGDTVVATVAVALASGASRIESATLANVAASIAVGKTGTAVVSTAEIACALNQRTISSAHEKILTLFELTDRVQRWRAQGARIALTNGCFDLLHPGHVSLLEQARRSADRLIVAVNSDSSVRGLKGAGRPIQNEVARATVLASLHAVDAVLIFNESTPRAVIEALQPDVLVKGADYLGKEVAGSETVLSRGGRVVLAELESGFSTSAIVDAAASSVRNATLNSAENGGLACTNS